MPKDGLGDAQDRRCFLVRKFENFFQHDSCLLFRFERPSDTGKAERDVLTDFIDEPGRAHQVAQAFELFGMLGAFLFPNQLRFLAPAFAFAQMVEAGVSGNAKKPTLEARFAAITANIFEHAYENVLQQIFGILTQRNHAIDVAEERLAPRLDERAERIAIALLSSLDKSQFVVVWKRGLRIACHLTFLAWRCRLEVRAATVYIGSQREPMICRGPRDFLCSIRLLLETRARISSAPGTAGGDCRKDRGKWRASPCREFPPSCLRISRRSIRGVCARVQYRQRAE